jgi:hypothetical protein
MKQAMNVEPQSEGRKMQVRICLRQLLLGIWFPSSMRTQEVKMARNARTIPHYSITVLDGVLDPRETARETGLHQVTQTDEVLATLFLYCHLAGNVSCPFYTGTTPHDIYLRFESMINRLDATQAIQQNSANASAIWVVLQGMKGLLTPAIHEPIDNFPLIATLLVDLEFLLTNLTLEAVEQVEAALPPAYSINQTIALDSLWSTGVACADNGGIYYGKKPSDFTDSIRKFENESWVGGEQQVVNQLFCTGWNIKSVERYGGKISQSRRHSTY